MDISGGMLGISSSSSSSVAKYNSNHDHLGRFASGSSLGRQVTPKPGDIAGFQASSITSKHLNRDGSFTPERVALHDKIIGDFLKGVPAQSRPTMFMNGGGPGAGKSSMTKGVNSAVVGYPTVRGVDDISGALDFAGTTNPGAVLIDPDALKLQLPEVHAMKSQGNNGWAAAAHEESSHISKRLLQAAMDRRLHIVNDGTGDSGAPKVLARVQQAKDAGYRVEANYLHTSPSAGVERALERAGRTGRMVPPSVIRHTYADIPPTFQATVAAGVYDKVRLFSNDGLDMGTPAKLVGEGAGADFTIYEPVVYGNFLAGK